MDAQTVTWWRRDDGQHALAVAAEVYAEEPDPVRAATTFRRRVPGLDADRYAATLTQARLRDRAVTKFGADAAVMLFESEALEQATRPRVAAHRAARLAAAEVGSVVDLGCGLGSDLIAFARAGLTAAGVDRDPLRVALAEANLAALGLAGAVQVADAEAVDVAPFGAAFCDPARRTSRGRTFDVEGWSPPWSFVTALLDGRLGGRHAAVKVAPGIPHSLLESGLEAEWVSAAGAVVEAALWSPGLATVRRRATVIGAGGLATITDEDLVPGPPAVRAVGRYLYEPDGAVIRAGLVTGVADGVDGWLLDEHIAYVSSDAGFTTPFARTYRVVRELPYREKPLRAALRDLDIGPLTVKKRGVQVEPDTLRARLALTGSHAATIVLTRARGRGLALLVEPI